MSDLGPCLTKWIQRLDELPGSNAPCWRQSASHRRTAMSPACAAEMMSFPARFMADEVTKDCSRLCFLNPGPGLFVNWDAKRFSVPVLDCGGAQPQGKLMTQAERRSIGEPAQAAKSSAYATHGKCGVRDVMVDPVDVDWSRAGEVPALTWRVSG